MNSNDVLSSIITQSTMLEIDHNKYIDLAAGSETQKPIAKILNRTMDLCREGKIDPWDVDLASFSRIIFDLVSEGTLNLPDAGVLISAAWKVLSMKGDNVIEKFRENRPGDENPLEEIPEYDTEFTIADSEAVMHDKKPLTLLPAPVYHKERRKVMLVELMEAISTIDFSSRQREKAAQTPIMSMEEISARLNAEEPEEEIQKVWNRIVEYPHDEFYMESVWGNNPEERAMFFVYCMFLCRTGKISLNQDEPFGNIKIKRMENA